MVFPFKQLRRWASRKKNEDSHPSHTDTQTSQAPTSSVSPISCHTLSKASAPSPSGEGETRAYIDGNPFALTQLYHAQAVAVDRARRAKTRTHGPNRYSIRARGRDATMALITQPDDSAALDQLLAEMIEVEQRKRQRQPQLPPFSRDAGGFIPLRELVAREVNLMPSPSQSPRVSSAASAIIEDAVLRADENPDSLLLFPSDTGGFIPLRELVGREVNLVPSPNQSPRVSSTGSAILEDTVLRADENPDSLPMNIPTDQANYPPGRVAPTDTLQERVAEEAMEECERPPSRRGRPPSCSDSGSSEYSDDDHEGEENEEEEEGPDYHRPGPPDWLANPQSFRSISEGREISHWRLQDPVRPPNPDFPRVYANILQIPDRNPRRTLTHSLRSTEAHPAEEPTRPLAIPPVLHTPSSPLTALPVYNFASPEGEAQLSYIRRYLSLPADMPASDLLVYLLKLGRSLRLDAAGSNPSLVDRADAIDWDGIEAHFVTVRRGDTADEAMRRVWDYRMVTVFLDAKVSLFTWDVDTPEPDGQSEDGGGDGDDGDDGDRDHDHELERKMAVELRRRGSILRAWRGEGGEGENLRRKFRILFRKWAEIRTVKREKGELPRLHTWTPPGGSQLVEVQVSEDPE